MSAIVGVASLGSAPTWADDIEWGNIGGGSFHVGANWIGGVVPGTNDSARFGRTRNPDKQAVYTVSFSSGPTNKGLVIEDDRVTFDLNGNAYLLNDSFFAMNVGTSTSSTGRLTLTDGVVATTMPDAKLTVGAAANAPGVLTISTGAQLIGPSVFVGSGGPGTLVVQNGGDLIGQSMFVGANGSSGATGSATVSGAGSAVVSEELSVGALGAGTLTINDGAHVESTASFVARNAGVSGTVNVDGTGSRWTTSDDAYVGFHGPGALNITGGARVQLLRAYAGYETGSSGSITVDGGGQLIVQGLCTVGNLGPATMNISGGSLVDSSAVDIGFFATATVAVHGAGSRCTCSSAIGVGTVGGNGSLAITGGAEVHSTDGQLARVGGVGSVSVSGAGSLWAITESLSLGGDIDAAQSGGTGTLTIGPGGTVTADGVFIYPEGTLELSGGTLNAERITYAFGPGGVGDFTLLSGVLHADLVEFAFENQGATLAPGHPAGFTSIEGTYTQLPAAAMEIEIGGPLAGTQFDRVVVNGTAVLGGQLVVRLINGFVPGASHLYVVLTSASITGAFANVPSGSRLAVVGGSGSFIVNYGPGSPFNPTQIVLSGFGPCLSDFNGDGVTNSTDVSDFINAWFTDLANGTLVTDFDHNGVVNSTDVSQFINQWFADLAIGCGG